MKAIAIGCTSIILGCLWVQSASAQWSGFHGNGGRAGDQSPIPISMSDMAWKVDMPGDSVASPIVVGDLVISTSSGGPDGEDLYITGVNKNDGNVQFEHPFVATGRPYHYEASACAAPSPVSDGKTIVAFFSSGDLFALDATGKFLWTRSLGLDYPKAGNDLGLASSPILADGVVVLSVESAGESHAIGIDAQTSETLWRIDRPKQSNWSTPVAITRPSGKVEVVLTSSEECLAVDPSSGETEWTLPIHSPTITSPVALDGMLLIPSEELIALRYDDNEGVPTEIWRERKLSPDNPTIISDGDRLYVLKGSMLVAGSMKDGEVLWRQRIDDFGQVWSSPLISGDHLVMMDQSGNIVFIRDEGTKASEVSRLDVSDRTWASPAVDAGKLIVRTYNSLLAF